MRTVIFLFYFFIMVNLKTNAQSYKDSFSADLCTCLQEEKESAKKKFSYVPYYFEICFKKHLTDYANLIDGEISENDKILKFKKGQRARRELLHYLKYELVYTCDIYYSTLVSENQKRLEMVRKRADTTKLEPWNQRVAMSPNHAYYLERAKLHFELGNLKEAEVDIRQSLDINPSNKLLFTKGSKLLLASILEEQKKYDEAIAIYDQIYLGVYDSRTAVLRAIVKRKNGIPFDVPKIAKQNMMNSRVDNNGKQKPKTEKKSVGASLKKQSNKKDSTDALRKLLKIKDY
jgi:tetratricopeptide (TPR) repeat protein